MKIKSIEIVNIGIISHMIIEINKPLNLIVGDVEQGKTTILDCIQYVLGAKFPADILRHGTDKGHIMTKWDTSSIKRVFRRKKDGVTVSDKIEFILNGELQTKPIDAIKEFLNPYLLDQDFFIKKTELERNKYFVELFNVDVAGIDTEIKEKKQAVTILKAKIDTYGEIDITPVEKADVYALSKERKLVFDKYASDQLANDTKNETIKDDNTLFKSAKENLNSLSKKITELEEKLQAAKHDFDHAKIWVDNNQVEDLLPAIPLPNTTKIDIEISDAKATNVKYERYTENKERYEEKQAHGLDLSGKEKSIRELRAEKIKKLADVSDKCGIEGLKFDINANAFYKGCSIGLLSTSQAIGLSSALKSLYPKGFGIELLDGAERLKWTDKDLTKVESIQLYIDRAEQQETTILATVVSDEPAKVPDEVGVWVVEGGKIKE